MQNEHNYAVIVAGGSGTRLWPLSREELPKQLQSLVTDKTLIEETVDRIAGVLGYENIFIATTKNYADKIASLLPRLKKDNIIVEPSREGTTAAFAYFTETIYRRDPEAVIFSLASDHAISEIEMFHATMHIAFNEVQNDRTAINLVGVKPTAPDTGMGYIKVDTLLRSDPDVYSVEKFVEKPSLPVAENYVTSGEYYWNAAYYCYRAETLLAAYDEADPAILTAVRSYIKTKKDEYFREIPQTAHEIEIINAKHFPLRLIPASFTWSDIGNWSALHDLLAKTSNNDRMMVSSTKQHIDIDSTNCLVVSDDKNKVIATVGLNGVVIVDTPDALLIMNKDHTQDIKAVLATIRDRGLNQYL